MPRRPALLCLLLLCLVSSRAAAQFGGKSHLTPTLLADTTTVAPSHPFKAGLLLKLDPGWHTYWEYPGEYGFPLTVQWHLPPGFTAGKIEWPLPEAHEEDGDVSFIYEREVMLLVEITPPVTLPPGDLTLSADLKWQVCEKTCIPGSGHVELTLATGAQPVAAHADVFSLWRDLLPQSDAPFVAKWESPDAKHLRVTLGRASAGKLDFYPLPPAGITPGKPVVGPPESDGHEISRVITVPFEQRKAPSTPWRAVVAMEDANGRIRGWEIAAPGTAELAKTPPSSVSPPPAILPEPPPPSAQPPSLPEPPKDTRGLARMLLLSFAGGLILNAMPCVLPVIALKIFGFVRQAGHEPARVFRLGLAFVAGVFTFFLGLSLAVLVLHYLGREFNWGFQFQNAYILAGLTALVFVFGLNLLGVFEVTLSGNATSTLSELSGREGYGGAFLHGLFTTLLGTSCTAPLLGPSLGYAVTQSPPVIVLLFLTVAAGMSLPYFLLTAKPAWLKYLPKPGAWMERFKQIMGFVMLGVGVWLFTQFAGRGPDAVAALSWYLLLLGAACWLMGVLANRPAGAAIAVIVAVGGYFALLHGRLEAHALTSGATAESDAPGIPWIPFSEAKLASSVGRGEPVFIDFTASWCWNCHLYEKTVLETGAIRAAFRDRKIVPLRADWSDGNPEISRWLKRFNRIGVPLYVLYRPGEAQPIVLDALTQNIVLSNFAQIK